MGRLMRANADARHDYAAMTKDQAYRTPLRWAELRREDFDGLLLPGDIAHAACANIWKAATCNNARR